MSGSFGRDGTQKVTSSASTSTSRNFQQLLGGDKKHVICGVCRELCKNPVILSKCFHTICGEHLKDLTACPNCNISLEGSRASSNKRLVRAFEPPKELNETFTDLSSRKASKKNKKMAPSASNAPSTSADNNNVSEWHTNASELSNIKYNKINANGETKLHIACRLGFIDHVLQLINRGANTNQKDNAGWTPLHVVVQKGRLDLVKLLLRNNALINVPGPNNETPLHEAVRYNHEELIEELVKNGAYINIRNCKGETPYQLATDDIKTLIKTASDCKVQTQSVNISHIAAKYSVIYCMSKFEKVHNLLKRLAKSNRNVTVEITFTKKVTHIIVDTENKVCTPNVNVFQAIMNSLWVLSTQWVIKSSDGKLEPLDEYEVRGITDIKHQGPRNSRYNRYKLLPGLFNGCHFYFTLEKYDISKILVLTKAVLSKLVTDAGGIVLERAPNPELIPEHEKSVPYHAQEGGQLFNCTHYIIYGNNYEPKYNMLHLKELPVTWLVKCMESYKLWDP